VGRGVVDPQAAVALEQGLSSLVSPGIARPQLMPFALVIELSKWRPASTGARRDRSVRHRNGTGNREQDGDQYRGADQDRRVPRRPMCTAAGPRRGAT
jgi:hypothetical protein